MTNEIPELTKFQKKVRPMVYSGRLELAAMLLVVGEYLSVEGHDWGAEITRAAATVCENAEDGQQKLESAWEQQTKLRSRVRQLHREIKRLKELGDKDE